jgi:hypothetical protein
VRHDEHGSGSAVRALASFPVGTCKAGGGDVPVVSGPGLVPGVIGAAALAQLSVSSAESPVSVGRLSVMIPVSGSDDT